MASLSKLMTGSCLSVYIWTSARFSSRLRNW